MKKPHILAWLISAAESGWLRRNLLAVQRNISAYDDSAAAAEGSVGGAVSGVYSQWAL
jgi:hypothetical protein